MSQDLHDIDKLFKDAIDSHEEQPPATVWDGIDQHFYRNQVRVMENRYRNLKRIAVVLLILLSGSIFYIIRYNGRYREHSIKQLASVNDSSNHFPVKMPPSREVQASVSVNNEIPVKQAVTAKAKNERDQGEDAAAPIGLVVPNAFSPVHPGPQSMAMRITSSFKSKGRNEKSLPAAAEKDIDSSLPSLSVAKGRLQKSTASATFSNNPGTASDAAFNLQNNGPTSENMESLSGMFSGGEMITSRGLIHLEAFSTGGVASSFTKAFEPSKAKNELMAKATRNVRIGKFQVVRRGLTAFFSHQFHFDRIRDDHYENRYNDRTAIRNDEQEGSGLSVGLLYEIPLGGRWSVQPGLTYMSRSVGTRNKKIFAKMDNLGQVRFRLDCSAGFSFINLKTFMIPALGDSLNLTSSKNVLGYIGIPVVVKYRVGKGKFHLSPGLGIAANLLVHQKLETEFAAGSGFEKQRIHEIQGLKQVFVNGIANLDLQVDLSKHFALSMVPSVNMAFSSINRNTTVKSYPLSMGATGGITYRF